MVSRQTLCAAALALAGLAAAPAQAYVAAGDRIFVATLLLPQIAPSDELYVTGTSLPQAAGRASNLSVLYDKTITDRLGIGITSGYDWLDQSGAETQHGWTNTDVILQYMAVIDPDREFTLSFGLDRNLGGTGARQVGASPQGATTGGVYFGKGLGEVAPEYLRPLAIVGNLGYQIGDGARGDQLNAGLALEYSIPYLESKVTSLDLPDLLRNTTPIVELLVTTPMGTTVPGNDTTVTIAPGATYAGEGWEFGLEALLPTTRATGRGVGVLAQFHLALDYLFPDSIGRPIFSRP
jgi:hypothetical protein